jgi:hypothetical protein
MSASTCSPSRMGSADMSDGQIVGVRGATGMGGRLSAHEPRDEKPISAIHMREQAQCTRKVR